MKLEPELVRRIDQGRLSIVELNRPERRNALTGPLMDQLADHVEAVNSEASAHDPTIGALLLCGADGAFCSGLDLKEYNAEPEPEWLATASLSGRRAHIALARCPVPVVVALERYAINGGAAFALAGDLIVVGQQAWLQVGEVRQGMAAPMNIAWLTARYPLATVLQIVLRGNRLDSDALLAMGIATEAVEDDQVRQRAEELAAEIADYPPDAAQQMKAAVLSMASNQDAAGGWDVEGWFERAAMLGSRGSEPLRPQSVQDC